MQRNQKYPLIRISKKTVKYGILVIFFITCTSLLVGQSNSATRQSSRIITDPTRINEIFPSSLTPSLIGATEIKVGNSIGGHFHKCTAETHYYKVWLKENSRHQVTLSSDSFDTVLNVYDSSGNYVNNPSSNGDAVFELNNQGESGYYYLTIFSPVDDMICGYVPNSDIYETSYSLGIAFNRGEVGFILLLTALIIAGIIIVVVTLVKRHYNKVRRSATALP